MPRSLDEIDVDLKRAVARRYVSREQISALSGRVIADTRYIDGLLAERIRATEGVVASGR